MRVRAGGEAFELQWLAEGIMLSRRHKAQRCLQILSASQLHTPERAPPQMSLMGSMGGHSRSTLASDERSSTHVDNAWEAKRDWTCTQSQLVQTAIDTVKQVNSLEGSPIKSTKQTQLIKTRTGGLLHMLYAIFFFCGLSYAQAHTVNETRTSDGRTEATRTSSATRLASASYAAHAV